MHNDPQLMADVLLDAIHNYVDIWPVQHVREIRVVVFQAQFLPMYQRALAKANTPKTGLLFLSSLHDNKLKCDHRVCKITAPVIVKLPELVSVGPGVTSGRQLLPAEWTAMLPHQAVISVTLLPASQEYAKVAHNFNSSLRMQRTIVRVQHLHKLIHVHRLIKLSAKLWFDIYLAYFAVKSVRIFNVYTCYCR